MPTDSRRIQGPEETLPYQLMRTLPTDKQERSKSKPAKYPNIEHEDGRAPSDHRKIYLKTGVISQAKGSAYLELHNTKVVCSVFDPREIPNQVEYTQHGELYCVLKFAPFSCPVRRAHQQDSEEKELSLNLKRALEPAVCRHEFPNFQVDVYALVLENDGGSLAAAITCASLALADAHVPMYDLVTAATLNVVGENFLMDPSRNEQVLDSTSQEQGNNHGLVTLSAMGAHSQVSQVWQTGSVAVSCLNEAILKLIQVCEDIYPLVQRCLVESVVGNISKKTDSEIVPN